MLFRPVILGFYFKKLTITKKIAKIEKTIIDQDHSIHIYYYTKI